MRLILLLLALVLGFGTAGWAKPARNQVTVDLTIQPATHSFSCRYTLTTTAPAAVSQLGLNLNRQFRLATITGPQVTRFTAAPWYDSFQKDTLQRLSVAFSGPQRRPRLTVEYGGQLPERFYTDSLAELTAFANWLPNLPDREYELVDYQLTVHVPVGFRVVSTHEPRRVRPGEYYFTGTAPNIELTAVAARSFTTLVAAGSPQIVIHKANRPATHLDTVLLSQAQAMIRWQNQTIGRQEPIRQFTFLLPGTNRNASGLLDNAAVITYSDFDPRRTGELLILAHEISHKWWGYGTWNDYNNWLNEGMATYSSLLYLRTTGDTARFRQELAKRRTSAASVGAVIGFDVRRNDYPTFRKAMYDKPTVILYELEQRLGTEVFLQLLATAAAAHLATTEEFLTLVERQTSRATRDWLAGKLST
ncbi:M1 family aminopeptidase [Hymenobacter cellulosivorans]|uniref:Peptidase M1 membrane alanine aminopeptidase domain-containing protein n=1 Tax=Hymenobacter cellulosivorans TaxID=2932249 RepID=A0ABY4FH25_9BACT|nr:M1 family aminopeptidase [Hymenobacter cellulosivorans]UOQ55247.1 hypothetical protein MUN80_10925 [Hymenobacter cellulosivorans]